MLELETLKKSFVQPHYIIEEAEAQERPVTKSRASQISMS